MLPFGSCGGGDAETAQKQSTKKKFAKKLKKIERFFQMVGYAPRTAPSVAPVPVP
jgi:CelD/BcsL family acetyltransferase involved in cellulose biosynthesis